MRKLYILKLRFRWWKKFITEAIKYSDTTIRFKNLKELEKSLHDRFIVADRVKRDSDDALVLEGQLQIVKRIINEKWE